MALCIGFIRLGSFINPPGRGWDVLWPSDLAYHLPARENSIRICSVY
jgi:hypothetical protein